ncbi:MAG: hypothetical protein M4579_007007 [Chaenotheca gracillima]|nr:MAG: hypothetical protein M4579_007007 [Chaenotheca gracillima]
MSVFEKMAHMHDQKLLRQVSDDGSTVDQVGDSAPASGVVTPRPDPADKRLPGIIHSFFGQVRATSSPASAQPVSTTASSSPAPSTLPITAPAAVAAATSCPRLDASTAMTTSSPAATTPISAPSARLPHLHPDVLAAAALPTAPSSPQEGLLMVDAATSTPSAPPTDEFERLSIRQRERRDSAKLAGYPTPPLSTSPSGRTRTGTVAAGVDATAGCSAPHRGLLPAPAVPRKARRHTFAVPNPLTSIITASNVHATHLSNPTAPQQHPATTPTTPTESAHPSAAFGHGSSSVAGTSSYFELKRLTEGASASPSKKNTPPLTPRSSSTEVTNEVTNADRQITSAPSAANRGPSPSEAAAALAKAQKPQPPPVQDAPVAAVAHPMQRSQSRQGANAATVGPPKGKLIVKISEARGLRPSYDPYVVCVFEWNEYISKGPKSKKELEQDVEDKSNQESGGIAIKRSGSDMGRPMAIPMKSRQSSNTSNSDPKEMRGTAMTDPRWDHEATFDVVGKHSEIDVSVYDRSGSEAFLGHIRLCPLLTKEGVVTDTWFPLEARASGDEHVSGEIYLQMRYQPIEKRQFGPEDFQILKLIGKGTFGQVYQVRKKDTQRIYAMKVLSKKVIVQKKEVAHTLGERNILVRTAMADSPFIVGLKFSFQTPTELYLVTDYMSGGELFWHLQKEGRFNEQRAKFYIAELILALQHLHQHDIVYRDLKPENILLDANGHIALCDFGLSKANLTKNDTTNTFCGTTEYLAPEVLLDEQGYTKMVDFWSLGVLVFEMCCGWSPFYAEDTQQMYKNIAFGKVRFPRDALSTEGRNFVKGLLNRNPKHRLGANLDAEELKTHPFFDDVDWEALAKKNVVPPFKPKLKSVLDTSNFDPEFTTALDGAGSLNARPPAIGGSTPLSPGMQANFKGFTFVDESSMSSAFGGRGRDDLERMDEDDHEEEENTWDDNSRDGNRSRREDRMSGVVRTGGGEDGVFNSNFDDM